MTKPKTRAVTIESIFTEIAMKHGIDDPRVLTTPYDVAAEVIAEAIGAMMKSVKNAYFQRKAKRLPAQWFDAVERLLGRKMTDDERECFNFK